MSVIAVKKAVIDPVFDSPRSFRLVPQRLQKLSPGAIGLPQPEQYISDPFETSSKLTTSGQAAGDPLAVASKTETVCVRFMFRRSCPRYYCRALD
jgi:hypothetical protein